MRWERIFRTRTLCAVLIALGLPIFVLRPDIIHLKDGGKIEGFLLSSDDEALVLRTAEGEKTIKTDQIANIEVGYSGVPVCYNVKSNPSTKVCPGNLNLIDSNRAVFATGSGNLQTEEIQLSEVFYLEIKKIDITQKIIPYLRQGAVLSFHTTKGIVSGRVVQAEGESITVTQGDANIELKEGDLESAVFLGPGSGLNEGFRLSYLLPGYHQIHRGNRLRGWLFIGSLIFCGAIGGREYLLAQSAGGRASGDPTFLLFNNQSYFQEFQKHQRNQAVIGGIAAVIYSVHLLDVARWSPNPDFFAQGAGLSISVTASATGAYPLDRQQELSLTILF